MLVATWKPLRYLLGLQEMFAKDSCSVRLPEKSASRAASQNKNKRTRITPAEDAKLVKLKEE
jgi:hypothetical protein